MDLKNIKKNKTKIFYVLLIVIGISIGVFVYIYTREQARDYSSLFSEDYRSILDDIGVPIADPIIPTIEQVNSWLHFDETSEIPYIEDEWICGDFAARLTVNAKEKRWRIYVAIMYYSYPDEANYGKNNPNGNTGHAFNLVYCQDGNDPDNELDVWYIEPQSDVIWNIDYGHYNGYTYYLGGLPGTVWDAIFWVNYYDYLG